MRSNNKLAISVLSLVLLVSYLAVGAFAITPSPNNTRSLHSPYGALALCCPRCSTDNCVQAEVKKNMDRVYILLHLPLGHSLL